MVRKMSVEINFEDGSKELRNLGVPEEIIREALEIQGVLFPEACSIKEAINVLIAAIELLKEDSRYVEIIKKHPWVMIWLRSRLFGFPGSIYLINTESLLCLKSS